MGIGVYNNRDVGSESFFYSYGVCNVKVLILVFLWFIVLYEGFIEE